MPIPITCKACGASFSVRDDFAGRRGKCPHCQAVIDIPKAKSAAPPPPPPPFEPPPGAPSSKRGRPFGPSEEPPPPPGRGSRPDVTVPLPENGEDDFASLPPTTSRKRPGRRDEPEEDDYDRRRKPQRRRSSPPGSGVTQMFVADLMMLGGGLIFLIGLFTLRSNARALFTGEFGFHIYAGLLFALLLPVAAILTTLGRSSVVRDDRALAGALGVAVILGWVASALLGAHAILLLISVISKGTSSTLAWISLILRAGGMICFLVAEILSAMSWMKLSNRLRHPSLGVFGLILLIAFCVVGSCYLLAEILGLSEVRGFTILLHWGFQYADTMGLVMVIAMLIAYGILVYPLLVAKNVLAHGYTPPPPRRSFDEDDDRPRGRRREPEYDDEEDDRPRSRGGRDARDRDDRDGEDRGRGRGRGRGRDEDDDY